MSSANEPLVITLDKRAYESIAPHVHVPIKHSPVSKSLLNPQQGEPVPVGAKDISFAINLSLGVNVVKRSYPLETVVKALYRF